MFDESENTSDQKINALSTLSVMSSDSARATATKILDVSNVCTKLKQFNQNVFTVTITIQLTIKDLLWSKKCKNLLLMLEKKE